MVTKDLELRQLVVESHAELELRHDALPEQFMTLEHLLEAIDSEVVTPADILLALRAITDLPGLNGSDSRRPWLWLPATAQLAGALEARARRLPNHRPNKPPATSAATGRHPPLPPTD